MLTSSATMESIHFFLCWIRDASPTVRPAVIMTDRDQAQINALREAYPHSQIWLCIWHVLRAMRAHFSTDQFQILWERVKALVKTEDMGEFSAIWEEIQADPSVPQSFIDYMKTNWMPYYHMWSKVVRKNRPIHLEGDTNMLIEAYAHFQDLI
jgi:transposase-like protein